MHHIEHEKLLTKSVDPAADDDTRKRIAAARELQAQRFGSGKLNASMTNHEIKQLSVDSLAWRSLNLAARTLNISARAYMRTVKVAQTIADLEASPVINGAHISEALAYRPDFQG